MGKSSFKTTTGVIKMSIEKDLTPINNQLFIVSYIGQGDTTPAQVRIKDTRFKKSITVSYDHAFRTAHHQARAELEKRGFDIAAFAYDESTGKGYFLSRDFRSIKEPAPAATATPYDSKTGNFRAYHAGYDKNGNALVKIKPTLDQFRAFSIQRIALGHISAQTKGAEIVTEYEKQLIVSYIANYGTDTQKAALKIQVFEYVTQTLYSEVWESVSYDETMTAARQTLREYRANQPQHSHRIIKRRIGA